MEIDHLKLYVSQSNPEVNSLLRNHRDASSYLFDNLFAEVNYNGQLYRLVPCNCVKVHDGIIEDLGYFSCSISIDNYISHVEGQSVACIQVDIHGNLICVNVKELLPDNNNEEEYILPRGQKYVVNEVIEYSNPIEIQSFLDEVNSFISVKELYDIYGIYSISHYKCSAIV